MTHKLTRKSLPVRCLLQWSVAIAISSPLAGQAQLEAPPDAETPTTPPAEALPQSQILYNAPPPPNQGTPGGRAQGGASRGPCQDYEDLTALVPTTQGIVWGQTTQATPTLWFYLPHPLTAETRVEFALQDANDEYVDYISLDGPAVPAGLISFTIDPEERSLQPDQPYTWTLVIYCDPTQLTESVFVKGSLSFVALDAGLQNQLANAETLDQAKLYAANGVWFDALNLLAEQYPQRPDEGQLTSAWAALLEQADLDDLIATPFSDCCQAD